MKIKKSTLYLVLILFIVIPVGFFLVSFDKTQVSGNTNNGGDFQKVVLGIKNLNYYPNTITVKEGVPVRIYLDNSVAGCLRSFTVPEFGVAKYLPTPNDYVEFTPNKKGTFGFACSMGMGTGKIIVE